jgi:peroxiredoxin
MAQIFTDFFLKICKSVQSVKSVDVCLSGETMTPQILTPGETAPDFELTDTDGALIRLSDFRGKKPVVLAFLRGFM